MNTKLLGIIISLVIIGLTPIVLAHSFDGNFNIGCGNTPYQLQVYTDEEGIMMIGDFPNTIVSCSILAPNYHWTDVNIKISQDTFNCLEYTASPSASRTGIIIYCPLINLDETYNFIVTPRYNDVYGFIEIKFNVSGIVYP